MTTLRSSRRDERGAYLILWMLMLTALLVMVAIVIDLGGVRSSRREAQRTSDLAAIAAGHHMATGDRIGACRAAVNYVRTNTSLTSLTETCATTFAAACNPTGLPVPMTTTSGRYVFHVENPIPDSEIADPAYPSGVLPEDGQPCERMRVRVEEVNDALFAGVIGVDNLTARSSSVVRGFIGTNPTQNAGLVVLERRGCEAIVAGGGSGQASVLVKGSIAADGSPRPGIIQVDTKALPGASPLCRTTGGNTSAKYAVFGSQLTPSADRPNQPSIEAEAIGGVPGRIDMFALAVNPSTIHAAYDVPGNGVKPAPTPGVIASRNVVDKVYNAPQPGPTPGRVSALKTASASLVASLASAVDGGPCAPGCNAVQGSDGLIYPVWPPGTPGGPDVNGVAPLVTSGVAACVDNNAVAVEVPAVPRVFVNCAPLDRPAIRFGGERVVIRGVLRVGSNGVAAFPNASEVIVGGCGGCSGGNTVAVNVGGTLLVNTGAATAPLQKTCKDGIDNDGDGLIDTADSGCLSADDWDERSCLQDRAAPGTGPSRLVVNTGPIETSSASVVQLCQTFVLLADGASLPHQDVAAATDLTCAGTVDISGAPVPQPCPIDNSYKGRLSLFGTIDWIAPNQNTGERNTNLSGQHFEDLALWTETSATSEIKGAGNSITGGVYFFPNATFNFSGQASQLIDLNAQFLARRLLLSGQGTLAMQPNPEDTVDTPAPFFKLIR
jgi:hypothetical protein